MYLFEMMTPLSLSEKIANPNVISILYSQQVLQNKIHQKRKELPLPPKVITTQRTTPKIQLRSIKQTRVQPCPFFHRLHSP